jgi:DNA-binding CsgD family transcriptional regulator
MIAPKCAMAAYLVESASGLVGTPAATLQTTLARFFASAPTIVRHIDRDSLLAQMGSALAQIIPHRNFIVLSYRDKCAAELIHTNLAFDKLQADLAVYINGLYVLDPFYISAAENRRRGVLRLGDIAPEGFEETEYYRMWYKDTKVADEIRFVVEVNGDELVHLLIEREIPQPRFTPVELQMLKETEAFIEAIIEKHWEWRRMSASVRSAGSTPLGFGVRNVIRNLKDQALTAREIDIVELSIKGHSSKSIAQLLAITEGTVINHKRHIYEKLGINSQSQLFHLFLQALYGITHS